MSELVGVCGRRQRDRKEEKASGLGTGGWARVGHEAAKEMRFLARAKTPRHASREQWVEPLRSRRAQEKTRWQSHSVGTSRSHRALGSRGRSG